MIVIIASNQQILEKVEINSPLIMDEYKEAIVKNYGGFVDDYTVLTFEQTSVEYEWLLNDTYTPVWGDDTKLVGVVYADIPKVIDIES